MSVVLFQCMWQNWRQQILCYSTPCPDLLTLEHSGRGGLEREIDCSPSALLKMHNGYAVALIKKNEAAEDNASQKHKDE